MLGDRQRTGHRAFHGALNASSAQADQAAYDGTELHPIFIAQIGDFQGRDLAALILRHEQEVDQPDDAELPYSVQLIQQAADDLFVVKTNDSELHWSVHDDVTSFIFLGLILHPKRNLPIPGRPSGWALSDRQPSTDRAALSSWR